MLDGFQRWVLMQTAILLRLQLLYLELCLFSGSLFHISCTVIIITMTNTNLGI
jgi:hypothetical protein